MKIVVTTFYYPNYKGLAEKTTANHRAYCKKHGYQYFEHKMENYNTEDAMDMDIRMMEGVRGQEFKDQPRGYQALCVAGQRNANFAMKMLLKLDPRFDYIFTIGCDAIFTDTSQTIEELTKWYPKDIMVGTDKAGINSSQMLIKNCNNSFQYFLEMLRRVDAGDCEHDQRYFWDNPRPFIFPVAQKAMNSYDCGARLEPEDDPGNWTPGDYIVHLAGMTLEQRMSVIDKWLGRVK